MLEVKNLFLDFGTRRIVDKISFKAQIGEIIGIIGPNAAGKSTSLKMLAGVLEPDSGDVLLNGENMWQDLVKAQANIGYLAENAPLYKDMSVKSYLEFIGYAHGIKKSKIKPAIIKAVETTNCTSIFHQKIKTLSKGYHQRVALAGAIIHQPKLLLLDEPIDGLDLIQKTFFHDQLNQLKSECLILISSHSAPDIAKICTRILFMNNGKIDFDLDLNNLNEAQKTQIIEDKYLELNGGIPNSKAVA